MNILSRRICVILLFWNVGCSTDIPKPNHKKYFYPKGEAFVEIPKRKYTIIGKVQAKVNFPSFDFDHEDQSLCSNYYNHAVLDLLKFAKAKDADAVIEVRSVTFLIDGRVELSKTAECSDEGDEAQILAQGIAIKWDGPADLK